MTKKKLFSVLAGLAILSGSQAFAWVGGPFDGGDYGATMDDQGIYQASLRFKNGSGFAQFGTNVDLGPSTSSGSSGTGSSATSTSSSVGSLLNRSMIYYKGIAFFGNAAGMVDMEAREVTCIANLQSEVTLSEQTASTSTSTFALFGTANTVNAASTAVNNGGRGFVANINFVAKIKKTYPEVRFAGTGEMTVINPDASTIISNLATQVVQSNSGDTSLSAALQEVTSQTFIDAITPQTIGNLEENTEVVTLKVYGNRKFFLSQR